MTTEGACQASRVDPGSVLQTPSLRKSVVGALGDFAKAAPKQSFLSALGFVGCRHAVGSLTSMISLCIFAVFASKSVSLIFKATWSVSPANLR